MKNNYTIKYKNFIFIYEKLYNGIKESEMIVIGNASHMLNVEQSKRFNEELINFLKNQ